MKAFLAALLCALLPSLVQAQAFPAKPVKIVVPFPMHAANSGHCLARTIAQRGIQARLQLPTRDVL